MPGNLLVRFDEGGVGRTARCRPLSYSTCSVNKFGPYGRGSDWVAVCLQPLTEPRP